MNKDETTGAGRRGETGLRYCLGISKNWGVPEIDVPALLAESGWNGFFPCWKQGDDLKALARRGAEFGLELQSVHAPWGKAADMWGDDEDKGSAAVAELSDCLRAASDAGAPFVVVHAWIGFKPVEPSARGIERFSQVVALARRLGLALAVENTEGENHLDAILGAFRGDSTVGFCWDTGHELCYNRARDLAADYGDILLGTHLNDNLGVSDPSGPTTYIDDLHLLPFDGIADWPRIASRLRATGFSGPLTFELNRTSKPGRHENDAYGAMPLADYLRLARSRAERFGALLR